MGKRFVPKGSAMFSEVRISKVRTMATGVGLSMTPVRTLPSQKKAKMTYAKTSQCQLT